MATFRLFVYGTLKRDGGRGHVLAGQRHLGPARTLPGYALYDLGAYPGLVRGGEVVTGELVEVDEALRPTLDAIEGSPTLFRLEEVDLDGVAGPVWAYFYRQPVKGRPRCLGGVWRNVPGRDEEE